MKHDVVAGDRRVSFGRSSASASTSVALPLASGPGDELALADRHVVVDGDRAALDEDIDEVTADEAGAADNERFHAPVIT